MIIANIQPPTAEHYNVTALPPEAEIERRAQAIINDPTFKERVGSDHYTISSYDFKTFYVMTEQYAFQVDIEIVPLQDLLGPGTIILHFGEIEPNDFRVFPYEERN